MARFSDRLKRAIPLALADWRCYRVGILAAAGVMLLLQILFGAVCPLRILLGIPCPGCGLTRAAELLLSGDLTGSLAMHPMLIPVLVLIASYLPIRYFFPKLLRFWQICAMIWIVATLILYGYRMLTQFPGQEPICLYEGLLQRWISALFRA